MSRPFLTARWEHLCIVTYAVTPEALAPHMPPGLEPDTRDGSAFVSLVAFDFLDTRVKGIKIPLHVNFPEINLRFYVRERVNGEVRRGVCFLREFVPRTAIAWVAKWVYNEPYAAAGMKSGVLRRDGGIVVRHDIRYRGSDGVIEIRAEDRASIPTEESVEHFFKEHRWGYGVGRDGRLLRYEVVHPVWEVFHVRGHIVRIDWTRVYGEEWGMLAKAQPVSVVLARGSEVSVSPVISG